MPRSIQLDGISESRCRELCAQRVACKAYGFHEKQGLRHCMLHNVALARVLPVATSRIDSQCAWKELDVLPTFGGSDSVHHLAASAPIGRTSLPIPPRLSPPLPPPKWRAFPPVRRAPPMPPGDPPRVPTLPGQHPCMWVVKPHMVPSDHSCTDFTGIDVSGRDLNSAKLESVVLDHASLIGSDLTHSQIEGSTAFRARFDRARLVDATIKASELTFVSFVSAEMRHLTLQTVELARVDFSHGDLRGAMLIAIASAQTTTFDHANMDGAVIKEAEFGKRGSGGSSFYNTSLEGAILDEMNCILCQMLRAHMHRVSIIKCDFEGAFLRWANLTSAKLSEVSLQGADLQGATLRWAVLTSVQLQAANLMAANLVQAFFEPGSLGSLAGADLRGAVAMGATFDGCSMAFVDMQWADFTQASFVRANLTGADLSNTVLARTNFTG